MISASLVCTMAAHEARLNRQLAMAAVDQHQKLHARRPAVIEQRIERGANRAAGVQDVVDQNNVLALHRKRDVGRAHHRLDIDGRQVVAVQVDVQDAGRNLTAFECLDLSRQPLRQRNAPAADADERELIEVLGLLEYFVRQPHQRPVDLRSAHELGFFADNRHIGSQDRVSRCPGDWAGRLTRCRGKVRMSYLGKVEMSY